MIKNHPNYMISDEGSVLRLDTDKELTPCLVNGHPKVILDGSTEYISRLVAEAFIPNINGESDVRHINGDKTDNNVKNLEWVSHEVTQRDSFGLGVNAPGGNMPATPVKDMVTGKVYRSIHAASKDTGVGRTIIRKQITGKIKYSKKKHLFQLL